MPRIRKRVNECPFMKRDNTRCGKRIEGGFCASHKNSQQAKFAGSTIAVKPEPVAVPEKKVEPTTPQTPRASKPEPFNFDGLSADKREKVQAYAAYLASV